MRESIIADRTSPLKAARLGTSVPEARLYSRTVGMAPWHCHPGAFERVPTIMSRHGRPRFEARVSQRADGVGLALVGALDEHSGLKELPSKVDGQVVYLDLAGVERINSCGVRDWMQMIDAMSGCARVVLINCSPAIVAQLNFVARFAGNATVDSILLPYVCPFCETEKKISVAAAEFSIPDFEPPECRCEDCDTSMTFDDLPQSYLAFSNATR